MERREEEPERILEGPEIRFARFGSCDLDRLAFRAIPKRLDVREPTRAPQRQHMSRSECNRGLGGDWERAD